MERFPRHCLLAPLTQQALTDCRLHCHTSSATRSRQESRTNSVFIGLKEVHPSPSPRPLCTDQVSPTLAVKAGLSKRCRFLCNGTNVSRPHRHAPVTITVKHTGLHFHFVLDLTSSTSGTSSFGLVTQLNTLRCIQLINAVVTL